MSWVPIQRTGSAVPPATMNEIATRTGEPLGTVKSRVRAALERLATLLEEAA